MGRLRHSICRCRPNRRPPREENACFSQGSTPALKYREGSSIPRGGDRQTPVFSSDHRSGLRNNRCDRIPAICWQIEDCGESFDTNRRVVTAQIEIRTSGAKERGNASRRKGHLQAWPTRWTGVVGIISGTITLLGHRYFLEPAPAASTPYEN